MTKDKFINLVLTSAKKDNFNLWEAVLAVKDHYNLSINDIVFFINESKTLKDDLRCCCEDIGKLRKIGKKSLDIDDLF